MFLNRNNDLQEFFWPIYYFVKQQVLVNHQLPLWNNLFLSGMPLLPDPQSPLFYPLNIIFLILPLDTAFITSIVLHLVIAAIGMYFCAKLAFGFLTIPSLFTSLLFITTPKFAGFLEAGHFGLILAYAWLPFVILSTILLYKRMNIKWAVFLSISLAAIFYTHLITFLLTLFSVSILFGYLIIPTKNEQSSSSNKARLIKLFLLSILITFGLIAITLVPQLEWKDHTTRFISLNDRIVYPSWNSKKEFIVNIFAPWTKGASYIQSIETEKWIPLTLSTSLLALIGFFNLKRRLKITLSLLIITLLVLSLNNSSPIYSSLLSQDWYVLLRVTTRVWFIVMLITIFLAGFAINLLWNKNLKKVLLAIICLSLFESIFLSWAYLQKPISQSNFISSQFYEFLKQDEHSSSSNKDRYRVFCISRCISQKDAAIHNLELVEGYNTVQQINFYRQSWQLVGAYWNHYTLSIPPAGTYTFEKPQPDPRSLGDYNTKYVISSYILNDPSFVLVNQFDEFLVYKNSLWQARAYFWADNKQIATQAPILIYTPNHIRVDTSSKSSDRLVLAEVYSPGWKAYLDNKQEVPVQEKPDALRLVNLNSDTKFVDFRYEPEGFKRGLVITIITIILIFLSLLRSWTKK